MQASWCVYLTSSMLRTIIPEAIQLSWAPLPSGALSHGTQPSRSLNRLKPAFLKSKVLNFAVHLSCCPKDIKPLHFTVSAALLLLRFIFPISPSLLVKAKSSTASLLGGSSVTWRRKLSSTHSRNLLNCFCPLCCSFNIYWGGWSPSQGPGLVNMSPFLSVHRRSLYVLCYDNWS